MPTPARETIMSSLLGFPKFLGFTGTGFAQPNLILKDLG